jgi:hypothetical protein
VPPTLYKNWNLPGSFGSSDRQSARVFSNSPQFVVAPLADLMRKSLITVAFCLLSTGICCAADTATAGAPVPATAGAAVPATAAAGVPATPSAADPGPATAAGPAAASAPVPATAGLAVPGAAGVAFSRAPSAAASRHLYVGNAATNAITIYDADANGNAAPARAIGGSKTGIACLEQEAVDLRGYLYVANLSRLPSRPSSCTDAAPNDVTGNVLVFAPSANGDVAPVRVIAGPATRIDHPTAVAVAADGTLYVGSYSSGANGVLHSSLLRFAPGAAGNVAPTAVLAYGRGKLDAITIDPDFGLIVSAGPGGSDGPGTSVTYFTKNLTAEFGQIAAYDPGPLAADPATKTFLGLLSGPNKDWVYRFSDAATGILDSPDAPGITPPIVSGFSVATCPVAIATDETRTIYVAGQGCPADSIASFAPDSSGDAMPVRQITGPATELAEPTYITVGP